MSSSYFSEIGTHNDCPHCNTTSFALKHPLVESVHFWVVCDVHPLTEGHLLVIPKQHYASIGGCPNNIFQEFIGMYTQASQFVERQYGYVATFEHGNIGQTIYHSHVHILPFKGSILDIVPEGICPCFKRVARVPKHDIDQPEFMTCINKRLQLGIGKI